MQIGRARLGACVAAGVLALLLLASWQRHGWPAWPLAGLIVTVPIALWVAGRERDIINWPGSVSALIGVLTGGLLGLLTGALPTGLESASRALAMGAIVPTLAAGPIIVCAWGRARRAFAVGCAAGLAVVGLCAARFHAGLATMLDPPSAGGLVLLVALIALAAAPALWAVVRGRRLMAPALLCALGLLLLVFVGTRAVLQRWATERLTDPATFLPLQITKEDTQDAFALGFGNGLLAMNIPQADLETLTDHLTVLVPSAAPSTDLRGRMFLPYASNDRGEAQPMNDLVASRWVRLVEKGTAAKRLTTEPLVLLTESVHHGARAWAWPGWWAWVVAAVAAVCLIGRKRCPGHVALATAVSLALLSLGVWRG